MTYLPLKSQKGVTLIELMIALALGLIISSAVIQILVSNNVTDKLNRAIASAQENGRFIISRIRQDVLMTGLYDPISPELNRDVDIAEEGTFVRNHAVVIGGDFDTRPQLGSSQGADGANDILVISKQGLRDCRGYKLGYAADEEFYVVNEYFVESGKLKCRGFDGRVLRGQKAAVGHNNHAAFTLLDEVLSFQVMYGITVPNATSGETRPVQYIEADKLEEAYDNNSYVVAIRLAIVVKGDGDGLVNRAATFKLLNEDTITAPDKSLYKAFGNNYNIKKREAFRKGKCMNKQKGLVMVFALLVLLSITILGISSVSSSLLQTKMATSLEKKSLSFDAAEAAIAGVVFESEDEQLLSDPNSLDPLSEARLANALNIGAESVSCFDDSHIRRNAPSGGMSFNTRHTASSRYTNNPPVNAWSKTVFVREQACRGSSNVIGGSNINCHVFLVRGCGQAEGSAYAVANTLSAAVFAPASN